MKQVILAASVGLLLAAGNVQAHAHLKASTPSEGAILTEMPSAISLVFSETARITAVSIQKDQDPKQKLTAPGTTGEQIMVDVPALAAGSYTLSWRVMSTDDNHIMSGQLHFKVTSTH